jgi:hypothetical protein
MKVNILSIFCLTLLGCVTWNPAIHNAHSEEFKNRYLEFIDADETQVATWYHYVKTRTKDNTYILRTFFPETKQITSEVNFKDKSTLIANGKARYWHENGNLKSEGNYSNSQLVGIWKYYHRKSGKISSKGTFKLDKKQGIWEVYDIDGRLEEVLNYENGQREGKFIQYDSINNIINEGIYKSDTIFQQTKVDKTNPKLKFGVDEQLPYLSQCKSIENIDLRNECSKKAIFEYLNKSLKYPKNARNYGIEGTTITQFVVDKDGSIKDIDVVIGLCQEFKDLNMKIMANMPQWEPGIQHGEKVKVLFSFPIIYKLD